MDNITNEQFNQALDRLPKSAQEFVTSQEFSDNLIKIGKKYLPWTPEIILEESPENPEYNARLIKKKKPKITLNK